MTCGLKRRKRAMRTGKEVESLFRLLDPLNFAPGREKRMNAHAPRCPHGMAMNFARYAVMNAIERTERTGIPVYESGWFGGPGGS